MLTLFDRRIGGRTLRELAWELYRGGAYRPPRSELELAQLVQIQRRISGGVPVPKMPYVPGNRKVGRIWTFDLPPVLTCPYATFCGRPGSAGLYRGRGLVCYDINIARYNPLHLLREYINFIHVVREGYSWLRDWTRFVVDYRGARIIRFHVGGDVFSDWYWGYLKKLASDFLHVTFYLYTRSFPIVAASPERPPNLVVLMSLDGANYKAYEKYGAYFDHITYLAAGEDARGQIPAIEALAKWAAQNGKRLIIFLEHRRLPQLRQALEKYSQYICPNELGVNTTCEKCRRCFAPPRDRHFTA
ncbi:GP88 family protein [Pyrobaculum neutrophilum]|uniref:Gene product 88 domain-containing protein n=1 Tax=Pyrobaculum neutrophilum (strain DSM 2338 / JCM 9278 / NBRC 100436 / V24Sta) TaxID=444157 RepID=B1YDR9_PYRNV|nr:hypothetical protein [Pyrobaculum neutrophilum]ACB39932.1 conserved hypothetical protein [Pyrobaculum neutrophilum V24Sta]